MGQKINPIGFRLGVSKSWQSVWYANNRNFGPMLAEDIKVRNFLKGKLAHASVGRVLIERPAKDARITIFSARPGVVIGKKGEEIEALKAELRRLMGVNQVHVNIEEIRKPEIDAQLISDSIAQQLGITEVHANVLPAAIMSPPATCLWRLTRSKVFAAAARRWVPSW